MLREELIQWIRGNDNVYSEINFINYSDDELLFIKRQIGGRKGINEEDSSTNKADREKLIEYIKANDNRYRYDGVNFKHYTDEELILLKSKIDKENQGNKNQ